MSAPPPPAPPLPSLGLTLGALYVGVIVSVFLFGIATLQTYNYYVNFPTDKMRLKALVGGLWVMDAFHCAIIAHAAYHYAIANYFNPAVLEFGVWSLDIGTVVTAIVACTCQAFFTVRVWVLGKNYIVTAVCAILCLLRLVLSIVTTYGSLHIRDVAVYEKKFGWSIRTGLGVATAADVCIAAALVYYLSRNQTAFANTKRLIQRMLTFTIETCLITSTVTVIDIICFATMPDNFVFLGLYFLVSKLYSNSLLTSLNARQSFREGHTGPSRLTTGTSGVGITTGTYINRSNPYSSKMYGSDIKSDPDPMDVSAGETVTVGAIELSDARKYQPPSQWHE
ncbi:hypothetical protein PUNSTDRAFT_131231 [Punctularia strigosozonata HHB-11173 SS5]|uniref:uncharacterized protein n=1 Tax=Punctularia strigosozonata (strain HHB-11173) TaxID=741275 RepID=UPI000441820B|nr:uncharacterized protein PUNSTDRAFT_131231 [Punctularia strigosozonata HHB-11173 SS5]EIN13003.1 hypothetical protein PUNSTDRAFT_131231 [Punctularia strigosozonata HHB-11173 SS5]